MCKKGEKMSENQLNVNGVNIPSQKFSANGVKMSILQQENKLLFDFLKGKGYKEDAIIYSTDVDKLVESNDTSGNNKLSIKEARAMGLEGSRKDVRSALKSLNEIKNSGYAVSDNEQYPVTVNNNETDFYNKDGVLLSNTKKLDGDDKLETFYLKGDKNLVDKTIETSPDKKLTVETTYENGDIEQPAETTINNNNDVTKIKYDWFEKNLNSKTTTHGDDVETIIYKNTQNGVVPKRIVSSLKSNPDSCKSIDNKYNDENKLESQTVEYSGAKISPKDKIIKEDIKFDPNTGKQTSNEITRTDGTKQYLQVFDGKPHEVGKDKDGNTFVVLDVPEGWSMSKIADEYGISRDDLLKANTNEKGEALYHTTNKGVEYFYINDKAVIPKPTKMPDDKNLKYSYTLPAEENNAKEVVDTQVPPEKAPTQTSKTTQHLAQPTVAKPNVNHSQKKVIEVDNKPVTTSQNASTGKQAVTENNKRINPSKQSVPAKPAQNNQQQKPVDSTNTSTKTQQTKTPRDVALAKSKPTTTTTTNKTKTTKTNNTTHKTKTNKINTSATIKARATKAKKVAPEYHSSKFRAIQKPLPIIDPRVTVKKSRIDSLGLVSEKITEYNLKNTMCDIVKKHDCTLTSALLREYSKPRKILNGQPYKYEKETIIQDLTFLKQTIQKAEAKGYKIPQELYAYIPPKTEFATPARIKLEIQTYEAVFGKGSANYHIPS